MSNTTWKRSGSIHQVRLFFFVCDDDDDDDDDSDEDDGPYLFSEYYHRQWRFIFSIIVSDVGDDLQRRAKTDNLSIPFSSLSRATQNTGKRCSTNASAKRRGRTAQAFGPRKSGSYRASTTTISFPCSKATRTYFGRKGTDESASE